MSTKEERHMMRQFLQGLRDVVAEIQKYPRAKRIVLAGHSASSLRPRIERYARKKGIALPDIIERPPNKVPERYVTGRDRNGNRVRPTGLTLLIEDTQQKGEKIMRIRNVLGQNVRVLLVASNTYAPNADYVAHPWRSDMVRWRMKLETPDHERTDAPADMTVFKSKRKVKC